jgi:ABC-type transport system involved in multi-copper enzyme maturation permease subunit
MSKSNQENSAYVRRFAFRPFSGFRKGRIYRLWSTAWDWWIYEWKRSRAVKFLFGFLIFMFVLTNLFLLSFKDMLIQMYPDLTPNELLDQTMKSLVRDIVEFDNYISAPTEGLEGFYFEISGISIFILLIVVVIGSGMIADDLSNHTTEIYYSKMERYEYILAKIFAFVIAGTILITIPYTIEFFLLLIGLGNVDLIAALPVLFYVIGFTEIVVFTYGIILLTFSSLTKRRLYTGLISFMMLFITVLIMPNLAIQNNELQLVFLLDVLSLLGIISFLLEGVTNVQYNSEFSPIAIDLQDRVGLEVYTIYGALGIILLLGLGIIIYQVYRRHT